MTFRGITSPVDNEICSILDFAERTSDLTTQLGSYFSWTVSQGGMAVEQRTKQVCHGDTFLLCLASRIAHPVHKRHVSFIQMIRSHLNRFIQGSRLSID